MQTILGAGGAIGTALAEALNAYTKHIRLVARNPAKVNETDTLFKADLLNADETMAAVAGSEVAYLTVGLPYKAKVWKAQWPVLVENVMKACKAHKAKLVFFDNLYMYDPRDLNPATEESTINPPSEKGKVRAAIAKKLLLAGKRGDLEVLIARSADFYGPGIAQNCMLNETVVKNLASGKAATWLGDMRYRHSFTYTPDAAKATALLGNTASAYGQVWHLPTADNPPTGRQWVDMIAGLLEVKPKAQNVPKWMVRILSLFVPVMREMIEMMYQYERDYVFESFKFQEHFDMEPTPYEKGIKELIKRDYPDRVKQD